MTTSPPTVRSLYEALADCDKRHGGTSPVMIPKICRLLDHFERSDDREGRINCINWLQRIAQRNPDSAPGIRQRILESLRSANTRAIRRRRTRTCKEF